MNNRIKELIKQATEVEHSHGAFGEYEKYYRLNPEKFAELIIKECLGILDDLQESPSTEPKHCAKEIRKHFGVEE